MPCISTNVCDYDGDLADGPSEPGSRLAAKEREEEGEGEGEGEEEEEEDNVNGEGSCRPLVMESHAQAAAAAAALHGEMPGAAGVVGDGAAFAPLPLGPSGGSEAPPKYGVADDGVSDPAAIDASASSTESGSVGVEAGTGSDGKDGNRGMSMERSTEPQGRGQSTEPGAGSGSCSCSGSGSGSSSTGSGGEAEWDNREALVALYESARNYSGGEAGERGTPVPPELRPPGREMDVLCEWRLEQLRVNDELGMFSRGAFGTFVVAWKRLCGGGSVVRCWFCSVFSNKEATTVGYQVHAMVVIGGQLSGRRLGHFLGHFFHSCLFSRVAGTPGARTTWGYA